MPTPQELETKFWKELGSQRTMMLGLAGQDDGHVRPMTAQFENDRSPIWFFTSKENALVGQLASSNRAIASFTSKGHDLFTSLHGALAIDNDRATIERLWNPFVAAWFERQGRSEARAAAPERRTRGNLAQRIEPGVGHQAAVRRRSQRRLQG